jgi:hypothetical protein
MKTPAHGSKFSKKLHFVIKLQIQSMANYNFFFLQTTNYHFRIQSHCNKLYKPVFLYTLCNPNGSHLVAFKLKLWTLLIHTETTDIISTLLMWMQVSYTLEFF